MEPSFRIYELLDAHELLSEALEVEFKSAKGGFPGSFWETYSSFANTSGGTIVLGISEKNDEIIYDGISQEQLQKYQTELWNNLNNRAKVSANLLDASMVKVLETKDHKYLLAVYVPPADHTIKPVYIGQDPKRGTFKRNHTGDYHCTPEEVRQMIADALPQKPDARILDNYSLEDLDPVSIQQYRQLFRSRKPDHPFLAEDDIGLLVRIGGWRQDRQSQKRKGLTAAGLLMFGRHQSILDAFPDFHVDYQEITEPGKRWSDRIFPDGTWEANLFQFYRRVWPKLSNALPIAFRLREGQRQDEDSLHEALREAFVNALVHADYSIPGGVVVRRRSDSFMLANPGNMLITLEQYYRGGTSIPRNTSIQNMFIMLGYGEKAGSGSSRIIGAWEDHHWRKPYIDITQQPARVELMLLMESLLPQKTIERLVVRFGEEIRSIYGDELIALTTSEIEGSISNVRLQQLVKGHSSDISKMLSILCKNGYLIPDGKGRGTTYRLNDAWHKADNIVALGAKVASTDNKVASLGGKVASLGGKVMSPRPKRLNRQDLIELILKLCAVDYKTAKEIAEDLNRDEKYLRNKIIPEMVDSGVLSRKFPDIRTHHDQAYKAAGA